MRFFAVAVFLVLVNASAAFAQQPTPNELIAALSAKNVAIQRELDRMYLVSAHDAEAAEAQKATLIEWLKAAQAKKK